MKYNFNINDKIVSTHTKLLENIPKGSIVLEFGTATGYMTKFLQESLMCTIYGVEIDSHGVEVSSPYCEQIIHTDVNDILSWSEPLKSKEFDIILFADILEHLYNPQIVLTEASKLLKKNGKIVMSIPNIGHNSVIMELLDNKFKYRNSGLLDDTHIRFFTLGSIEEMLIKSNLYINKVEKIKIPPENTELYRYYEEFPKEIREYLMERLDGEVYQYILVVSKSESKEVQVFENEYSEFIEVFWDNGEGFHIKNSIKEPIERYDEMQVFKFNLSSNKSIKSLRIDPVNNRKSIEIDKIIINKKEICLRSDAQKENLVEISDRYYCINNDPKLIIDNLDEKELEIEIRQKVIESQTNLIELIQLVNNRELKNDIRKLVKENDLINSENKFLKDKNIKLEKDIQGLLEYNRRLIEESEALRTWNNKLQIDVGELIKGNENLVTDVKIIRERSLKLENDTGELTERNQFLTEENIALRGWIDKLDKDIVELRLGIEKLCNDNKELSQWNNKLQRDIDILKCTKEDGK